MDDSLLLLVPTTGKPHCRVAERMGARLAQHYRAGLRFLAVARGENQVDQGQAVLRAAGRLAESEGVAAQGTLRVGTPAREILKEAVEARADLIVMGSRPWYNRLRNLLGSTSRRVIARAPCPVIIAKGEPRAPNRVLVCDSGLAEPRLIPRLIQALPFLLTTDMQLTVLHVMSQMSAGPGVKGWELRADASALLQAQTPEGELLQVDAQLLQDAGVKPRFMVRHGLVVEEIMAEAIEGEYDLVVIGAHQRGGWQYLLLDDLQQQIIACLDRPVLVVR